MELVRTDNHGQVRLLTLAHAKSTNPFSREMKASLTAALRAADSDSSVGAVVVTGGVDRSFSAGGDFNEVRQFNTDEEVDAWIDRVTDLYLSVLDLTKPSVAAIDKHAIGIGFQLAMMFDWKVMSTHGSLSMPELEHGIGASMAAAILTATSGYDVARQVIMSCQPIGPDGAMRAHMVDEVTEREFLLERSLARATRLSNYPRESFLATKRALTEPLRSVLESSRQRSKLVHRQSFRARAMHTHFDRVLSSSNKYTQDG